MAALDKLRSILVSTGVCSKATVVEETGECALLFCRGEPQLLIAYAEHRGWVYAKAVPEELVNPYSWHCSDVFYNPYGLYSFARSLEELARKLAAKKPLLRAQRRLGLERLAGLQEG